MSRYHKISKEEEVPSQEEVMFWVAKETGEGSTLRKKIVGEEILNGIPPLIPISPPISLSQPSESRQLW